MRLKDREITDVKEMESILERGQVCHLGLSMDGQPYVVPMNYGYRDGYLYLHSAPIGQKVDMARKNPRVCFEVDVDVEVFSDPEPCEWGCRYQSVIGTGWVEFLEKMEDKSEALNVLMEHYAGKSFEFPPQALSRVLVWKVKVDTLTGKKYK
ncbi:MAG TPA: pyridoxamine 5'-phosphate oxidase family protein [Synergistales bacterium]|nr:pyridoxamine 5'-phosphate oxidase family protein [Synergistales bacterium]